MTRAGKMVHPVSHEPWETGAFAKESVGIEPTILRCARGLAFNDSGANNTLSSGTSGAKACRHQDSNLGSLDANTTSLPMVWTPYFCSNILDRFQP